MEIDTYVKQFNVLGDGTNDIINCNNSSQILYTAILHRFRITMNETEYELFKEYHERVFDLIENLRELTSNYILSVLNYLHRENRYLCDIIIMLWCLPRTDTFLSKQTYYNHYKDNIQKYHYKMVVNIKNECIKTFCLDILSKIKNIFVPVHCIDYIWNYMSNLTIEFSFFNTECGNYLGLCLDELEEECIILGLNMEHILELGLGQVCYPNILSFRHIIIKVITDIELVNQFLTIPTHENYRKQLCNILKDPTKYFGKLHIEIPNNIKSLVN